MRVGAHTGGAWGPGGDLDQDGGGAADVPVAGPVPVPAVIKGASLILFSLTADGYGVPCVLLARERRYGWNKKRRRVYTDFGGALKVDDGCSAEALAAREFVEETLGAVQYFATRNHDSGSTRRGFDDLLGAVQRSLEDGHYLAKMRFRLSDGAEYVAFLKQVPWQPSVSCKFRRARDLLVRAGAAAAPCTGTAGGPRVGPARPLTPDEMACLADHPAVVVPASGRIEQPVTLLGEFLEKTDVEYFSVAALSYYVDTGTAHSRAPFHCLPYFRARLRAALHVLQRYLHRDKADLARASWPTLAYLLPVATTGGKAAPPVLHAPDARAVPQALLDSQMSRALVPRTGVPVTLAAPAAERHAASPPGTEGAGTEPAVWQRGRAAAHLGGSASGGGGGTSGGACTWHGARASPPCSDGVARGRVGAPPVPAARRRPGDVRFKVGPLRNVVQRVLIDNRQRWRAGEDELRTRCTASDNSTTWGRCAPSRRAPATWSTPHHVHWAGRAPAPLKPRAWPDSLPPTSPASSRLAARPVPGAWPWSLAGSAPTPTAQSARCTGRATPAEASAASRAAARAASHATSRADAHGHVPACEACRQWEPGLYGTAWQTAPNWRTCD